MKKPTKKVTKKPIGVPMPRGLKYFRCHWDERRDGSLIPVAMLSPLQPPQVRAMHIPAELRIVNAWLRNPATPKGVAK